MSKEWTTRRGRLLTLYIRTTGLPTSSSTHFHVHCVFIFAFIIKPCGTIIFNFSNLQPQRPAYFFFFHFGLIEANKRSISPNHRFNNTLILSLSKYVLLKHCICGYDIIQQLNVAYSILYKLTARRLRTNDSATVLSCSGTHCDHMICC